VLFGEIVADSLGEVEGKALALKALLSVAKVDSIAAVIPEADEQKLLLIRELQRFLADLSLQRDTAAAVDLDALRSTLSRGERLLLPLPLPQSTGRRVLRSEVWTWRY
jgi:hypothetical protein